MRLLEYVMRELNGNLAKSWFLLNWRGTIWIGWKSMDVRTTNEVEMFTDVRRNVIGRRRKLELNRLRELRELRLWLLLRFYWNTNVFDELMHKTHHSNLPDISTSKVLLTMSRCWPMGCCEMYKMKQKIYILLYDNFNLCKSRILQIVDCTIIDMI